MPISREVGPNLEHNVLRLIPDMHANEGGIFAVPLEARYQVKRVMSWLAGKFSYGSLHELRQHLAEGLRTDGSFQFSEEFTEKTQGVAKIWVESHGLEYDNHVIENAFKTAESVIDYFAHQTSGLFAKVIQIQPLNEVASERNALTLLGQSLVHPDSRIRFEASRKLYLADMALGAERIRKDDQPRIDYFYNLLNTHMFTSPAPDEARTTPTALKDVHFMSYHLGDDFRCGFLRKFKPNEQIDESTLRPNMRIHTLPMRTWFDKDGTPHHVLIEPRVKDAATFIIKELRNDTSNPQTLDDNLGAKLTFETVAEAELFLKTFQSRPIPVSPILSEVSHTINEDGQVKSRNFTGRHAASSKNFEIIKYHITLNGVLYEIQVNTIRTWIDAQLRDEVCWDDYAINRVTKPDKKNGIPVTELLFPHELHGITLADLAPAMLIAKQSSRRSFPANIPAELRRKGRKIRMMTALERRDATDALALRILESETRPVKEGSSKDQKHSKDMASNMFIIIAEEDSSRLEATARLLGRRLGIPHTHVLSVHEFKKIPKNARVLIFDDIYVHGKHINGVKSELTNLGHPNHMIDVAVLIADDQARVMKQKKGFYFAETLNTRTTRVMFPFENETPMYSSSSVALVTRKAKNTTELLVEVLPNGKFKLLGGKKQNTESPKRTVVREIKEELQHGINPKLVKPVLLKPIMTDFEPHQDLTKTYSLYLMHSVFRILPEASIKKWKLPSGFAWVDIRLVGANLRWEGQKQLWEILKRKKIITW